MLASIQIRITGLDTNVERMEKIKLALADMTDVMESLASRMILFYEDTVFSSRGEAIGENWPDLKPATQAYKDKKWPGRDMLVRTGAMQQGFTSEVTPRSLFITNKVPYFIYHQDGTPEGRGRGFNIPARKMLAINDTVEGMITEEIRASVHAKIDGI